MPKSFTPRWHQPEIMIPEAHFLVCCRPIFRAEIFLQNSEIFIHSVEIPNLVGKGSKFMRYHVDGSGLFLREIMGDERGKTLPNWFTKKAKSTYIFNEEIFGIQEHHITTMEIQFYLNLKTHNLNNNTKYTRIYMPLISYFAPLIFAPFQTRFKHFNTNFQFPFYSTPFNFTGLKFYLSNFRHPRAENY